MCVTRWFWKLENGYKDEHSSIHQHRCPLCCCLQQHSPPVSGCSTKGKRCCCKFGHILAENKHLSISLNQCALQNLQVFLHDASVATLDTVMLCYPDRLMVQLNVTPTEILISADSSSVTYMESSALQKELELLNSTMQNPVSTYIGGIPG